MGLKGVRYKDRYPVSVSVLTIAPTVIGMYLSTSHYWTYVEHRSGRAWFLLFSEPASNDEESSRSELLAR